MDEKLKNKTALHSEFNNSFATTNKNVLKKGFCTEYMEF